MVRRFERGWYVLVALTLLSMAAFPVATIAVWDVARVICFVGAVGAIVSIVTTSHPLARLSLVAFPFLARSTLYAVDRNVLIGHRAVTAAFVNLTLGAAVVLLQIAWDCEDWMGDGGE